MSKHTPGPWVADFEAYPIMVRSKTETWPLLDELGNQEGESGAFVCNAGDNKANARLIAAAPELLEALEFIECVYRKNIVKEGEPSKTLNDLQSVIAKATGEAA